MKKLILIGFFIVFSGMQVSYLWAVDGFEGETVVSGLVIPTAMAFVPDGRILVAEKGGTVRSIENGVLSSTPVITLTDVNNYGDRGLIGIAVDPNFLSNGYVYLAYTYENSPGTNVAGPKTGRIVRVTVIGNTAQESSKVVLLGSVGGTSVTPSCEDYPITADCIPSDDASHSMGGLGFGPDGYLYATLGDGASFDYADPRSLRAQELDSLAGKMVRIHPDGSGVSDNPYFTGDATANQSKIWALGVRNMFRFSFQPGTNILFGGDVGWSTWEEINIINRGANYGWPCYEGVGITLGGLSCSVADPTPPWHTYVHNASGAGSVTGGDFLSSTYPSEYIGSYVYGDYAQNTLRVMRLDTGNSILSQEELISNPGGPVDIKTGPDGSLYYIAIYTGEVKRINYTLGNSRPTAVLTADVTSGAIPLLVNFSALGSSDLDGDTLSYDWSLGDGTTATGSTVSHTYTDDGSYTVVLIVSDGNGGIDTKNIRIDAGSQPPSASILSPNNGSTYNPGDNIILSGTGFASENQVIGSAGFAWQVLLHHNTHTHFLQSATGYETSFVAPDHEAADVYVEIVLTVTDTTGLSTTSSVNMYLNNEVTNTGNLINNAGMEENTDRVDTPDNWTRGWFGNNDQIWSYPIVGDTSPRGGRVEITRYVSGDAKWVFDPITIQENTPYFFSNSYRSSLSSDVIVDFGYANGTHTFQVLDTLPATSLWTSYEDTFTSPVGARTATVYHIISGTGWIETDNYTLIATLDPHVPPITRDDSATGTMNSPITIPDILANDYAFGATNSLQSSTIDVDILTPGPQTTLAVLGGILTVSPSSGIGIFTPQEGFDGVVSIPYTVEDTLGQKSQASINIEVSRPTELGSPQTLFFEGFEDQTFNQWISPHDANFVMSQGTCRAGPDTNIYAVKIVGDIATDDHILQKSISTLGYTDIQLSFCYKWDALEAGESVLLEYSVDNIVWTPVKTIDNSLDVHMFYAADDTEIATSNGPGVIPTPISTTSEVLTSHSITLPSNAANAAGLALRIREALGDSDDFIWIDDIRLVGTPLPVTPPPDSTPPVVNWIAPLSGSTLSGIVQLTTNITDDSGLFSIHYMIGGQDISGDGTTSPYTYTFDTRTLSDGTYTIVAHAHDSSGNETLNGIIVHIAQSTPSTPSTGTGAETGTGTGAGTGTVTGTGTQNTGTVSVGGSSVGGGSSSSFFSSSSLGTPEYSAPTTITRAPLSRINSGMVIVARDVKNHPHQVAIETLIRLGIMRNTFKINPDRPISRAEFMKLLAMRHGYSEPLSVSKRFLDVPRKHSLINYINYGVAQGWVNTKNIRFRPNDTISQGEIDKLIAVAKGSATADTIVISSSGVIRGKAASDIIAAFPLE